MSQGKLSFHTPAVRLVRTINFSEVNSNSHLRSMANGVSFSGLRESTEVAGRGRSMANRGNNGGESSNGAGRGVVHVSLLPTI